MSKTRPIWTASAAQAADRPRLAEGRVSLGHDLALKRASREPAGRGLSPLVSHIGTRTHAGPRRRSPVARWTRRPRSSKLSSSNRRETESTEVQLKVAGPEKPPHEAMCAHNSYSSGGVDVEKGRRAGCRCVALDY
eukprot:scaffold14992_cov69-Phaeocystis_antarctica.AAC.2